MLHSVLTVVVVASSLLCKGQSADSSTEPDVTLVISPDNKDNYCVASGSPAVDSALAWVSNDTYQDYKFLERTSSILSRTESRLKCSFHEEDCTSLWKGENWSHEGSYYNALFPRTDAAWEDFSVNYDSDFNGVYKAVNILKNPTYFFGLSLKINGGGHFVLCQDAYVYTRPCYTVIFNFFGTRDDIEIFKCANGVYHYSKNCTRQNVSKTDQHIFSVEVWRHFLVAFNGAELSVYGNLNAESNHHRYEKILSFDDVDPINVTHIAFKDNYNTSRWKLHDYTFIKTTTSSSEARFFKEAFSVKQTFCLSMAVALCDGCTFQLHLRLADRKLYNSIKVQGSERVKDSSDVPLYWKVERFEFTISTYEDISAELLYSTTATNSVENPFWAVDDVRECQNDEQRILRYVDILPPPATCQVLGRPDYIAVGRRHGGAIGEFSTNRPCKDWMKQLSNGKFSCKGYRFCSAKAAKPNINHCTCFPGYNVDCNVLTHITSIELVNTSYRHGQVRLPSEAFNGTTASFMKIQYQMKLVGRSYWQMVSELLSIDEAYKSFQLRKLVADETHELQALLYIDGDPAGVYTKSPIITFTTTCTDIDSSDVTVSSTEDSITFHLQTDDSSDKCTLYQYSLFCKEQVAGFYSNDRVLSSDRRSFTCAKVKPFTKYEVSIQTKPWGAQPLYHKIVTTKQSAPSKVRDIQRVYSTKTSISISWMEPSPPNGVIKCYIVSYKIYRHQSCAHITTNAEPKNVLTKDKYITIEGLIPFSIYNITVQAWVEGDDSPLIGPAESAFIDTKQEEFTVESMPKLRKNQTISREYATLTWSTPKCEDIRGSIWYNYYLTGHSEWDKQTQNGSTQYTIVKIEGLIPFSIYTVYLGISRTQGGKFGTGSNQTYTFRTQHKFPPPLQNFTVYSVDTGLVFVRWMPPYPPFGEREGYFWKPYKYYENRTDYGTEMDTVSCPLWEGYLCAEIKGLKESQYYIVYARNKVAALNGDTVNLKFTWKHKASSAPPNFTYVSTDNNLVFNLTWEYPFLPNGKLKKFRIDINVTSTQLLRQLNSNEVHTALDVEINEIKKNYYFQTPALPSASRVSVTVTAINKLPGEPAILMIDTEVPAPNVTGNITAKVISDTLREIKISPGNINITQTSGVYILVMEVGSKNNDKYNPRLVTRDRADYKEIFEAAEVETDEFAWIAVKLDQIPTEETTVSIGDDSGDTFWNKPLDAEKKYYFIVLMYNEINSARVYLAVPIDKVESANTSGAGLAALLLLLLVPVIIYFGYKRYKEKMMTNKSSEGMPLQDDNQKNIINRTKKIIKPKIQLPPIERQSLTSEDIEIVNETNEINDKHKVIKISEFEEYVKMAVSNGELLRQYEMFPRGMQKPAAYGVVAQNKSKNRYNNLIAYDSTRVHLQKLPNDKYSDYINANYIDGYKCPKAYIATQGPKEATVADFWRLIWQENVSVVAMLANTVESGKNKCYQYWPLKEGSEENYGSITVRHLESKIFADYVFRTLNITENNKNRKVEHIHYTTWPDHGVPLYIQSIVPYVKKLLAVPQGKDNSPLLVHCSAGVGRTGTIILADICLRMAAREGQIDVVNYLQRMRNCRPNLVDNPDQYKFVHLVVVETLFGEITSIPCQDLNKKYITMKANNELSKQMQNLRRESWKDEIMKSDIPNLANSEENYDKNRCPDIFPDVNGRVYISRYPLHDEFSDYINAIYVDGFRTKNQFIATQFPMTNTVGAFWRLVLEQDLSIIVVANEFNDEDETLVQFWPDEQTPKITPVPYINVVFEGYQETAFCHIITANLINKTKKSESRRLLTIIHFKNWSCNALTPSGENPTEALVTLWEQAEKLSDSAAPILVTCLDGTTACGLFTAIAFLIEKIKLEHVCDVCHSVNTVRRNRKQFVINLEQFEFLYESALTYLSMFQTYSNFQ